MSKGRVAPARHPLQAAADGERVVIVGTGESGAVALSYFNYDSPHEVVAFAERTPFLRTAVYCGLPVVPFEQLAKSHPPDEYKVFVGVSATKLNRIRGDLYREAKGAGFDCVSYVSTHAFVLPNVEIGENAFIQENTAVQNKVHIGNNVLLGSGSCIRYNSVVEDDCYFAPNATVCGSCTIGCRSFIGANSYIGHGLSVAEDCVIGAGAIILKDTSPRQVYLGNPARPVGRESSETWPARMA